MTALYDGEGVTLIFTTIARNNCVRRLVESALGFYPALQILVADQNPPTDDMAAFYGHHGVGVHWVPYDFGVSAGRAELARKVKTPFLIYGDDDFVFTERTRIAPVMEYLKARPEVALVTGGMINLETGTDGQIHRFRNRYETYLYRDIRNKGLIAVPIDFVEPLVDVHQGEVFYPCDLGLNWAMARTSLFEDERFLWDPQFKTGGEHENFFLQIKEFGGGRVMFYPDMECDHAQETHPDYEILRSRDAGWRDFAKKWGVEWFLHVGASYHRYDDYRHPPIRLSFGANGSAPQLPPRHHDYLRVWANGSAAASVSHGSLLTDAKERLRDARIESQQRIQALNSRIQAADADNRRMAERLALAPPVEGDPELRRKNVEFRQKIADLYAVISAQRENIEDLRAMLEAHVEQQPQALNS